MKAIWIIARKELNAFFDSLTAYILLVLFLGFSGLLTWIAIYDIFFIQQLTLQPFFQIAAYWGLFLFIPALTMRMLAEENRTGTIELLLTKAVTNWQVIIGKALACLVLIIIALGFTLPYYITLTYLGDVDHGAILCGYLGLILMSCVYICIGLFASSITDNQIVAFLIALFIGLFFHLFFGLLTSLKLGMLSEIFDYLSMSTRFDSISRGVIDTTDLFYFVIVSFVGLVLAENVLSKRNIVAE